MASPTPSAYGRLIFELRAKYHGLDKRLTNGDKAAAIRLFCLECMGGSQLEVTNCTAPPCPLYEFRLTGRWVGRAKRSPRGFARASIDPTPYEQFGDQDGAEGAGDGVESHGHPSDAISAPNTTGGGE